MSSARAPAVRTNGIKWANSPRVHVAIISHKSWNASIVASIIDGGVFKDDMRCLNSSPNKGFSFRSNVLCFGVKSVFETEDSVRTPTMLVVANQFSQRIG